MKAKILYFQGMCVENLRDKQNHKPRLKNIQIEQEFSTFTSECAGVSSSRRTVDCGQQLGQVIDV